MCREQRNSEKTDSPLRAEEIIAAVYGRISALREKGSSPAAIVLPMPYYRIIQEYRSKLGETPQGFADYLGKYELFGVPLYTDNGTDIVIRTSAGTPSD